MDFVDVHGRSEDLGGPVGLHVKLVAPFVAVQVGDDGGGGGAHFGELGQRVHLHVEVAVGAVNLKTVEFAFTDVRDKDFPNAGAAQHTHLVAAAVPAVEVAYHGNGLGVRGPDGELNALEALVFHQVRAQLAVKLVVGAARNQVPVKFRKHRLEGVRVGNGVLNAVALLDNQVVEEWLKIHVQDGFVESGVAQLHKVEFHLAVAGFAPHEGGLGLVGADDRLDALVGIQRVDTQH